MLGIIIQARMGSQRLPGKVLMDFCGKTLLEHIVYRLNALNNTAKIVIATSEDEKDNPIVDLCENNKIEYFRGSEANVLKRYYDCAESYHFDNIVRLTGDNPLTDIEELDRLIELHINSKADYSESLTVLPIGIGAEIMSWSSLKSSYENAFLEKHFEHVNEYILDNTDKYNCKTLEVDKEKKRSDIYLTVDTKEDYIKMIELMSLYEGKYITTKMAIDYCDLNRKG